MAVSTTKPMSNIAAAFAAQSVRNDSFHAPSTCTPPTPPSSLSPTLSAARKRRNLSLAGRVRTPDSMDIDLQDAVEHAAAQDQPSALALSKEALAGLDATRQITALLLARHYLPDVIVGHGAMPIREMMAHLTQSVPGFSGLPPAKARRLVVAALEHRAGGGVRGEIKFEKVGWGRWSVAPSSHRGGGVPITNWRTGRGNGNTSPASVDSLGRSTKSLQIPSQHSRDVYSGSWAAGSWSPPQLHTHNENSSEDDEMADQMSLDSGSDSDSASDMDLEDADLDLNDDTDQEDWSTIGPQPRSGPRREHRDYNYLSRTHTSDMMRQRSVSAQARSVPNTSAYGKLASSAMKPEPVLPTVTVTAAGTGAERDAIEALIAMGSM